MVAMSPEARPAATQFEPGSGVLPPALEPAILESDSPILLLVAPDTGDAVARAAIGLAESRGRAGHAVILADASAREPRLHQILDVENTEGLADVFLFGASLDHVQVRPETRAFDFIPIGAFVPDPSAVLASTRWDRISRALRDEGTRMMVFVPADSPGLGILSKRVREAVLLGDARSVERSHGKLDPSCRVVAVVEPGSVMAPERLAAEAGATADPEATTIFDEPKLTEPVIFRTERKSRQTPSPVLLLLAAAALAAAAWLGYQRFLPAATTEVAAPPPREAPPPGPRGNAVENPIPFSVQVEAHQDLAYAMERAAELNEAEPDMHFFLAPLAVRGVLYYRLLAGPAADRTEGERLMERLVEADYKMDIDPWSVLPTEHAFHLGEFDTEAAAQARVRELAAMTVREEDEEGIPVERPFPIPAYIVSIPHEPGPPRYRVYGGAYVSEAEAAVMENMLMEAGIEPRLVSRTGEALEGGHEGT